jgi:hypothetical protein
VTARTRGRPATVEGSEYAYVMPDEIDGGVVSMRFRNNGKEPHEFALIRIGGGHTIDETIREGDAGRSDLTRI